ncbi:MAG: hypothetical protein WA354_20135, partial [Terracidiphilus sp.]
MLSDSLSGEFTAALRVSGLIACPADFNPVARLDAGPNIKMPRLVSKSVPGWRNVLKDFLWLCRYSYVTDRGLLMDADAPRGGAVSQKERAIRRSGWP